MFSRVGKAIDNFTKDGGSEEFCLLCNFYHEPLYTEIQIKVTKFAISSHFNLILCMQAPKNYLRLTCEYELHTLPSTKVSTTKDHGENYMKVRPPLIRHLLLNHLFTIGITGKTK